jgi:phosphoribosylformylglycinamidine cyclo-ligase
MVAVVAPSAADAAVALLRGRGVEAWVAGSVGAPPAGTGAPGTGASGTAELVGEHPA